MSDKAQPPGPYAGSPAGWWTQYGGRLDLASGVVAFPPTSLPACRFPECQRCRGKETK